MSTAFKEGEMYHLDGETVVLKPSFLIRVAADIAETSLEISPGDKLLIEQQPGTSQLTTKLASIAQSMGAEVLVLDFDPVETARFLAETDSPDISRMVQPYRVAAMEWADKVAFLKSNQVLDPYVDVPEASLRAWRAQRASVNSHVVNTLDRLSIFLPTAAEAAQERMSLDEYIKMFYEACDRDWGQVEHAQDILINKLNHGRKLRLLADDDAIEPWKTDLSMRIDGMKFANSTIWRNYPGSEVFAAPVDGTVTGHLALPYPVMFGGRPIPNLLLYFSSGRVVAHEVGGDVKMERFVREILDSDKGSRSVGEIAFGTNPALSRPLLNPLFAEKTGGSFHIAIGRSYKMTSYFGREVNVDNGVESSIHCDLTRMMLPEFGGGTVLLDGELLQENGRFVDLDLAVLNPTDS